MTFADLHQTFDALRRACIFSLLNLKMIRRKCYKTRFTNLRDKFILLLKHNMLNGNDDTFSFGLVLNCKMLFEVSESNLVVTIGTD